MEWGRPESKPRAGAPKDRLPAQLPLTLGMRVTCKSQGLCHRATHTPGPEEELTEDHGKAE